jgi:hypothetical protein
MENRTQNFWNQLLIYTDTINDQSKDKSLDANERLGVITELLDSLEEIYGKNTDPVDEFEVYVTTQFCRALRKNIA